MEIEQLLERYYKATHLGGPTKDGRVEESRHKVMREILDLPVMQILWQTLREEDERRYRNKLVDMCVTSLTKRNPH